MLSLLARAIETIPLGIAYAAWTGIGAGGNVIVGIFGFGDPVTLPRLFFLAVTRDDRAVRL